MATKFRKWATSTLREYIIEGAAIDEEKLAKDPRLQRKLAARIRHIRKGCLQRISGTIKGTSGA